MQTVILTASFTYFLTYVEVGARLTEYERERVGDGKREEIVVGGGVHVAVSRDDHTRGDVSEHPRHQYQTVDDAQRHGGTGARVPLSQVRRQVPPLRYLVVALRASLSGVRY